MSIKNCKYCSSINLKYVTNYEHFNPHTESDDLDDGWLCEDCECFHSSDDTWFEFYGTVKEYGNTSYKQLME